MNHDGNSALQFSEQMIHRPLISELPRRVVIVGVDFSTNRVWLRNTSGEAIDFRAERGWSFAMWPRTEDLPMNYSIAADTTIVVHITDSGTNDDTNLYLGLTGGSANLDQEMGELSFYSAEKASGPFRVAEEMEAFLHWGRVIGGGGSSSTARTGQEAGLWNMGEAGETGDGVTGIVAAGDVADVWSWLPAAPECF